MNHFFLMTENPPRRSIFVYPPLKGKHRTRARATPPPPHGSSKTPLCVILCVIHILLLAIVHCSQGNAYTSMFLSIYSPTFRWICTSQHWCFHPFQAMILNNLNLWPDYIIHIIPVKRFMLQFGGSFST